MCTPTHWRVRIRWHGLGSTRRIGCPNRWPVFGLVPNRGDLGPRSRSTRSIICRSKRDGEFSTTQRNDGADVTGQTQQSHWTMYHTPESQRSNRSAIEGDGECEPPSCQWAHHSFEVEQLIVEALRRKPYPLQNHPIDHKADCIGLAP